MLHRIGMLTFVVFISYVIAVDYPVACQYIIGLFSFLICIGIIKYIGDKCE
jgi:hypothetical protein